MLAALPPRLPGSPPLPTLLNGSSQIDTTTIGFRYDIGEKYALKGQLDHWKSNNNSNPSNGALKLKGNLFTLVFDGVF
jgi:hypothetical protein